MKIEELNLPDKTYNCLLNAGITTVEELQEKTESEVKAIKGMSDRRIAEIRKAIEKAEHAEPKEEIAIDKYNENVGMIRRLLIDAAMDFCAVGYYLKEIRDKEQYKEAGYSSIWECAKEEFGLSKSAASRHMAMNDMYSVGGNSSELDTKYINFNKSQLQEMMYLPENERESVTPSTTVAEIRKLNPNSKESKTVVAISQQKEVLPEKEPAKEISTIPEVQEDDGKKLEDYLIKIRDNCLFDGSQKCNIRNTKEVAKSLDIDCQYTCCYSCHELECGARCNTSARILAKAKEDVATSQQEDAKDPAEVVDDSVLQYREIKEEEPAVKQMEMPVLKNMEEREQFIRGYKNWPVWCVNEHTEETFYRYELPDGSAIVVKSYPVWLGWKKIDSENRVYYLLKPGYHHFADTEINMTALKDHLKEVQKNRK